MCVNRFLDYKRDLYKQHGVSEDSIASLLEHHRREYHKANESKDAADKRREKMVMDCAVNTTYKLEQHRARMKSLRK
jgi:hypothetical protein